MEDQQHMEVQLRDCHESFCSTQTLVSWSRFKSAMIIKAMLTAVDATVTGIRHKSELNFHGPAGVGCFVSWAEMTADISLCVARQWGWPTSGSELLSASPILLPKLLVLLSSHHSYCTPTTSHRTWVALWMAWTSL